MATFNVTGGAPFDPVPDENDIINGDGASNSIRGGNGNDSIFGNDGNDTLDGQAGNDLLVGGTGNDVYIVDSGSDQIIEGTADAADTVQASVSYALAADVGVDFMTTTNAAGTAAINLTGNNLQQIQIVGNAGANVIDGGVDTLAETFFGGGGNDTYIVRINDQVTENANEGFDTILLLNDSVFNAYTATSEVEVIQASNASGTDALNITGNATSQTIVGNNGVNTLSDGGGTDTLIGLGGNDVYNLTTLSGTGAIVGSVVEAAGGGVDTVNVAGSFAVGTQDIEIVSAAGAAGNVTLTGSALNQTLTGSAQNDTLIGGGGTDSLIGGVGNDEYRVDSLSDVVVEAAGAGTDRVVASIGAGFDQGYFLRNGAGGTPDVQLLIAAGYSLSAAGALAAGANQGDGTQNFNSLNTTNSTVTTANPTYLVGNTTSQVIVGDAGSNILNGYSNAGDEANNAALVGVDTLIGGQGDDIYRVYQQADVVFEDNAGGGDIIYTSATYSLTVNDTNAQGLNLTNLANGIAFSGATFLGGAVVATQIEVLSASTQAANLGGVGINLTGNAYGNIVIGDYGSNTIIGGGTTAGGVDVLYGLLGNDTYQVDSVQTFVNENAGEGTDTANVTVSGFTLNAGSSVEVLNLVTAGASSIVGNELNQTINGNAQNNTLNGGGGTDTLVGGDGNDVYTVDDQSDVVTEVTAAVSAGAGYDTIFASANYDLRGVVGAVAAPAVEVLAAANQSSTVGLTLTGNGFSQTIIGASGDDILNGDNDTLTAGVLTGTPTGDRLVGLGGNDTYRVYSQADVVIEAVGGGTQDVVFTSGNYQLYDGQEIETLSAANQGATTNGLVLRGNERANVLIGNDGNNVLDGRLGNDLLIGRGGNDDYQFTTALGSNNVDTISGFNAGDRIVLDTTIFVGINGANNFQGDGAVGITEFRTIGSGAQDADDFILYDQATGQIFFDADANGIGQAVLFAQVDPGYNLGYTDFAFVTSGAANLATPAAATTII